MLKLKRRAYEILELAKPDDLPSRIFDTFIICLISLNTLAVILETVKRFAQQFKAIFYYFEIFSIVIFSIEYILRIWSCTANEKYRHPLWGRLRFMFTPLLLVDLFAILPFYLPMLIPLDLRFIRILRLFRIFRIFKLERYMKAFSLLKKVFINKKEELLITLFLIFVLLIFTSSLMFFIEHNVQPEKFSSIPQAVWWGIVTLTTVGYGDIYPITSLGKILGAFIILLSIGFFALPAGILASGFIEIVQKEKRKIKCPYCGNYFELD